MQEAAGWQFCAFDKSSAARLRAHVVLLLQAQVYKFSFGKLPQKWKEAFPSNLILPQKSLQIKKG